MGRWSFLVLVLVMAGSSPALEFAATWGDGMVALVAPWDGHDDHVVVLYDLRRGGVHHMSWFADLQRTKTHERLLPAIPISTREGARAELRDPGVEAGDPRLYELAVDIITGQVAVTRGARRGTGAVVIEDADYRDELALLRQGRIPAMLE